jgi:citrate synthase
MAARKKKRTVRDVMTTPVIAAEPGMSLQQATQLLATHGVGSVMVVEDERPIGILTERDLVRLTSSGADLSSATVAQWMTRSPKTVDADADVDAALNLLAESKFRHIPVVTDGKLVGIVSIRDLIRIAEVRPFGTPAVDVPKGLKGVVVAETEIGDVRGADGFYHYRQYNAIELAEKCSLEEVWHLLHEGRLPSETELDDFRAKIRKHSVMPHDIQQLLPGIARLGTTFVPLEALRSSLSLLTSSWNFRPWLDVGMDQLREQALMICAVFPTLVMSLHRFNQGLWPVDPHPDLSYAANYLYMWKGEQSPPEHVRAVEQYLISTIDHGFNASTFTARVVTSTGADMGAAVVAALGSLSGPLHGGAPSRALEMLDAIKSPEEVDGWIRSAVASGKRIMGFGHPVYKTDDPRSVMLRGIAERLGGPRVDFAKLVEKRVVAILEELKPGRQLYTNVEFYASIVMESIGLPPELFTPTFACSRVIGWTANILEQAADNRIIRPSGRYIGPPPPQPVPELHSR